ncbi:MAG: ATP-binding protein [Lachnospiraceae bacterium]
MPLTNTQYDAIMRQYNLIQARNRQATRQRRDEVYEAHPDILAIDNEIIALSSSSGPAIIMGGMTMDEYRNKLAQLNRERCRLLMSHGYPADYLDGVYDCKICHDTGYVDNKKCRCFNKRAIDLLYTQSNIKNIISSENFNTFCLDYYSDSGNRIDSTTNDTPRAHMVKNLKVAKDFVKDFDSCNENLLFYGDTGVGKTFLSNCIADELIRTTHSVIYLTAIEFFDVFSSEAFRTADISQELPESHYCLDCDLLIIDDLGTELTNSFTVSKLFYCLNERILRKKSTIISTNMDLENLRDKYDERIFSRILSNYRILYFYGDDIRIRKKQLRNSLK